MVKLIAERYLADEMRDFVIYDKSVREKVFSDACPLIEEYLASMNHLSAYEWLGKQAFYNPDSTTHLKDGFHVFFDGKNFEVSNWTLVPGARGSLYNLFDLLWEGFGPYESPTMLQYKQWDLRDPEVLAYLTRTKKMTARVLSGVSVVKMTYYYRYPGIMIRYATRRGGMDTGLVSKFQLYVEDAIRKGIRDSIKNNLGDNI